MSAPVDEERVEESVREDEPRPVVEQLIESMEGMQVEGMDDRVSLSSEDEQGILLTA